MHGVLFFKMNKIMNKRALTDPVYLTLYYSKRSNVGADDKEVSLANNGVSFLPSTKIKFVLYEYFFSCGQEPASILRLTALINGL